MAKHTSPPTNKDLEFIDISREEFREYQTSNGTYRIENPVALAVKPSGSHRVLSYDRGIEKYVSHYIPTDGVRPIKWVVKPGKKFFVGWGPTAIENLGLPYQTD